MATSVRDSAAPQVGPAFPDEEYADRLTALRSSMDKVGLEVIVCIAPESLFYISGYDANTAWSDQALVVHSGPERPKLLIRDIDRPLTTGQVRGTDVVVYSLGSDEPAGIVRDLIGQRFKSVGLEYRGASTSYNYVHRLKAAISPGRPLADASPLIAELRVRKSPAELGYVREAAAISDAALDDLVAVIRPGLSELQVAGALESALRMRNSEYPGMPVWMGSGTRTACAHASPSEQVLRAGEPLKCSFAAVRRRYHVTAYQSFYLGAPPASYQRVFGQCEQALDALVGAADIGVSFREACEAGQRVLKQYGLAEHNMGRWGYGVGIAYPPTWLEPMDITLQSDGAFDIGMVFCLHVSMALPESGFGFTVGANYMVTASGVERVNRRSPQIIEIDAYSA